MSLPEPLTPRHLIHSQGMQAERVHAIDAVRAAALLLGIALHASLSFVPGIELSLWPISDTQKSVGLGVMVFVIHIFRMAAFFLVAGFLARGLFHRLGWQAFVRNRIRRIFVPLIVFWIICFVIIAGVVVWAIARANGGQLPQEMPAWALNAGLNFMHLWFLYILLWLYALVLALRALLHALNPSHTFLNLADRTLSKALSSFFGTIVMAIPVGLALLCIENWDAKQGTPTPAYTLIPAWIPTLIYAYVFGLGWLIGRQQSLLGSIARRWPQNFVVGAVAVAACLAILSPYGVEAVALPFREKSIYAACYGIALICWTLALVGAGVRFLSQPSPQLRYLSDASYWMFIAHLPLVMFFQTALMLLSWHWAIKYTLINGLSVFFLLLTYHFCVRSSWIGQLLNGRRHSPLKK